MTRTALMTPSLLPPLPLIVAATVGAAFVLRAIRRSFSPDIVCKISCQCGSVQGVVTAKRQDSIRIFCHCGDCRQYAAYVASLSKERESYWGKDYTQVVQVCKSAIHLFRGQKNLKLARKAPFPTKEQPIFMHRYYASCCSVPMFNTVSFLGFVGIFVDCLDANSMTKFDGPVQMFSDEAIVSIPHPYPDPSAIPFMWKLLRYHWWRKSGPFDYDQEPVYWGGDSAAAKKES